MESESICCICAASFCSTPPGYDDKKPVIRSAHKQLLGCCGRVVCSRCITSNTRFNRYCPFCQISFVPSPLPPGLRDPPTYSPPSSPQAHAAAKGSEVEEDSPPSYDGRVQSGQGVLDESKRCTTTEDILHFVNPDLDSIPSLSLKYGVPGNVLKRKNDLFADHLLAARRCILIPGEYYTGISLSPQPVEGEEEDLRKSKIRRWMMACKVSDYDIAQFYLKETRFDLEEAIAKYKADEEWEKMHPCESGSSGKPKRGRTSARWLTRVGRSR